MEGTDQDIKIVFDRNKDIAKLLFNGKHVGNYGISFQDDPAMITLNDNAVNPVRFNIDLNSSSMYFLWKDGDKIVREEMAFATLVRK